MHPCGLQPVDNDLVVDDVRALAIPNGVPREKGHH